MSFKRNGRKKLSNDCQNRKALYDKHIPCISGAIASIIDKSRNCAFKMHCQELLEVDCSNMIQDAVSSKLFMLTLGKNTNGTSHNKEAQKLPTCATADTAFADLADHDVLVENEIAQWSFLGAPCLENITEELRRTNHKKLQTKEILRHEIMVTENQETRKTADNATKMLTEADISTPDDDFESLEDDIIFSEFPSCDAMREDLDQRVPCSEETRSSLESCNTHQLINHQTVIAEQTGRTEIFAACGNDDHHFETLGIFM